MEAITLKDIAVIVTPFLILLIGIGNGVIGYFLKSLHREFKEQVKETYRELKRIELEHMEFKALMPTKYVLKDDYVRSMSVFEKKLDDIGEDIKKITGRKNGGES